MRIFSIAAVAGVQTAGRAVIDGANFVRAGRVLLPDWKTEDGEPALKGNTRLEIPVFVEEDVPATFQLAVVELLLRLGPDLIHAQHAMPLLQQLAKCSRGP